MIHLQDLVHFQVKITGSSQWLCSEQIKYSVKLSDTVTNLSDRGVHQESVKDVKSKGITQDMTQTICDIDRLFTDKLKHM